MSMTQVWVKDKVIAVTPVLAGPCTITQVKTKEKDGYEALQIAYGTRKEKNINKPQLGHVKNLNIKPAHFKEFLTPGAANFKVGDIITAETFATSDIIDVSGVSKGKGFQGVVKRHHFGGFRKTHGNKDQERMSGSVGPKGPAHVFKGTRMGGRMGGEKVTTANLEVISVIDGVILIKGSVPGAINSLVMIKGQGDLKVNLTKSTPAAEEVKEEVKTEEVKTGETKIEEVKVAESTK